MPKRLSFWLNNLTGICVATEECYALACYSLMAGLPEVFVSDQEVGRWAQKYGFYDGAMLTDVMDVMAKDGLNVDSKNYKDGPYNGVDFGNELVLQSALSQGPVKIGIDANALPSGAGNGNGWFATSGGRHSNEDHCVGLSGYGRADFLYEQLTVTRPSGLSASTPGYLLFTWNSIGFITHEWLMGCCAEAWLRNPTDATIGPINPTPVPPPPVGLGSLVLTATLPAGSYTVGDATLNVPVAVPPGTYPLVANPAPPGPQSPGSLVVSKDLATGSYVLTGAGSLAVPHEFAAGTYPMVGKPESVALSKLTPAQLAAILAAIQAILAAFGK